MTKLQSTKEALKKCPDLVLVSGEDLTPYRAASKKIQAVLQRFGTAERLGMDEIWLDITAEAKARLAQGRLPSGFAGHLQLGHQVRLPAVRSSVDWSL